MHSARGRSAVVTVVDADPDSVWVWWVNTSMAEGPATARKTGAWELHQDSGTFSHDLEALLFERMGVATKAGRAALDAAGVKGALWVDLNATLAAVIAVRDEYQQVFDAEQATRQKSKRMRELQWPVLPEPIDLEDPPAARGQGPDANVGKTLAIAAWVDQLVRAFEDVEAIRADRAILRDRFEARDFPAVLL